MNVTRNEKTISVKTYLGQVSKSIDKVKKSIANDITNGLTFSSKRLLENNIKEKNYNKIKNHKSILPLCSK